MQEVSPGTPFKNSQLWQAQEGRAAFGSSVGPASCRSLFPGLRWIFRFVPVEIMHAGRERNSAPGLVVHQSAALPVRCPRENAGRRTRSCSQDQADQPCESEAASSQPRLFHVHQAPLVRERHCLDGVSMPHPQVPIKSYFVSPVSKKSLRCGTRFRSVILMAAGTSAGFVGD